MTLYWHGDKVKDELKEAVIRGAYITAEQILADAVKNAPKMTGTLRRSGTISFKILNPKEIFQKAKAGQSANVKRKPGKNVSKIYISFNTPYAYRQHEDLSLSHDGKGTYYTAGGKKEYIKEGGAKYLEKAWNDNIQNIYGNIKYETKKAGLL